MSFAKRQAKQRTIEALELLAKQFRRREGIWPFRVPHEPLTIDATDLKPRIVLRMDWAAAEWTLWSIALPSGILIYGDADNRESRILASARRGNPTEADGFFLERLAESRGHHFGIEMAGPAPGRVRSSIGDREFLTNIFVELFEGTEAEASIRSGAADFRADVEGWLTRVLTAPAAAKRQPRLADTEP